MKRLPILRNLVAWVGAACIVAAYSGAVGAAPPQGASVYTVQNLTSDGAVPAAHVDDKLRNPWGLAFDILGPVWIADNGSSVATLYFLQGFDWPIPHTVEIPSGSKGPANPTGIVQNINPLDFLVLRGGSVGPALFVFAGEGGTLAAWTPLSLKEPLVDAATVYDDGKGGAVYKGLALATKGLASFLYATDFHNAKVDVFDSRFHKTTTSGGFRDPNLPAGFAPFGIQAIGDQLYVSFAKQQGPEDQNQIDGPGLGIVDLFDTDGKLLRRVATGGSLNSPWGMVLAPANFGQFSNDLLIGNFGDGAIDAFDPVTGAFIDRLRGAQGQPLAIPNLWGLVFGNNLFNQPSNALFFTAGSNHEVDGLYGRIDAGPAL